jgi:DNA-directed RNA polymerase specialized sigma24 family protein
LAGESDATELLTAQALKPLYAYCLYRVGRNTSLCEDVTQETMLRAVRTLENYDPIRANNDIFPWLTSLARNEIQRAMAHEKHNISWDLLSGISNDRPDIRAAKAYWEKACSV